MFERFTEPSRRVVVLAQEEARMLDHNYIGTEHILLGLIHEGEGVAARAIVSLGLTLEMAREQVRELVGAGKSTPTGHIPFTPPAKKVLELSLREALALKKEYIGTEHILLGLVHEGHGAGAQILVTAAPLPTVREKVLLLAAAESSEPGPDEQLAMEWLAGGPQAGGAGLRLPPGRRQRPGPGGQRVPGDAGVDRRDAGGARTAADRDRAPARHHPAGAGGGSAGPDEPAHRGRRSATGGRPRTDRTNADAPEGETPEESAE